MVNVMLHMLKNINPITHGGHKMVKHTFKILQHWLQDF